MNKYTEEFRRLPIQNKLQAEGWNSTELLAKHHNDTSAIFPGNFELLAMVAKLGISNNKHRASLLASNRKYNLLMQRDLYVTCERCCHNEGSLSKDTNFNSHINECSISHCYCSSCQCYNKFIKYQQVYFLADTYTSTLLLPLYQSI